MVLLQMIASSSDSFVAWVMVLAMIQCCNCRLTQITLVLNADGIFSRIGPPIYQSRANFDEF